MVIACPLYVRSMSARFVLSPRLCSNEAAASEEAGARAACARRVGEASRTHCKRAAQIKVLEGDLQIDCDSLPLGRLLLLLLTPEPAEPAEAASKESDDEENVIDWSGILLK